MAKLSSEERAKDIISYRIIIIFTLALISILALIPLGRYVDSPGALLVKLPLIKILIGVGVLALAGGIVLTILQKKKGKPASQTLFLGIDVTVGAAFFLASMIFLYFMRTFAVGILYFAYPAVCVLAIIYYIYQREFSLTSLYTAAAIFFLYLESYCRQNSRPYQALTYGLIAILLGAAVLVLTTLARKSGGKLGRVELCGARATLAGPKVMLIAVVLAAAVCYFLPNFLPILLGVLAVYLVTLVGYTVKLPN